MLDLNPEYGVIGSILLDGRCLDTLRGILTPDDFQTEQGRAVFQAACTMADDGRAIDPITLRDASGAEEKWLVDVLNMTPTAAHAEAYAQQMRKQAQLSALRDLCTDLEAQTAERDADPVNIIGIAQERLEAVSNRQTGGLISTGMAITDFVDHRKALKQGTAATVSSGFPSIDGVLGSGFLKTGLYILAARPGVGKTSLGLMMAEQAAKKHRVLFVSLEMSETEIMARRVANISGIGIGAVLHNPDLPEEKQEQIGAALYELSSRQLTTNRGPSATVAEIGVMARSCKAEFVVIDYLGLIQSEQKNISSYERITRISNDLKRLSRSLGCPVLCLAQLNRQSEARQDKKPVLSNLRDSGAIEQDADGVLLIHRPALFWDNEDKPKPWDPQPFEVNIAKNRHGPTGSVTLQWYASNGRFQDKGANTWL